MFSGRTFAALVVSVVCATLVGCDSKSKTAEIQNQLANLTKSVSELVGDSSTTKDAMDEFRKLQQYEYKLQSFPADTMPIELEAALNRLGKERWECFHVDKRTATVLNEPTDPARPVRAEIVLFCKRRPETPLRFIPRGLISAL